MEEWQHLKLTDTNGPCGLTISFFSLMFCSVFSPVRLLKPHKRGLPEAAPPWGGGYSEEATPVPIPNTVVKLLSPDGTARVTTWESRTLPPLSFF